MKGMRTSPIVELMALIQKKTLYAIEQPGDLYRQSVNNERTKFHGKATPCQMPCHHPPSGLTSNKDQNQQPMANTTNSIAILKSTFFIIVILIWLIKTLVSR